MTFSELGLSPALLNAVAEEGYETPSPVQAQAIPAVLAERDVMAAAQTGTGKTAGFTLPMLQRLSAGEHAKSNKVRALVLTPTRELAAQVADAVTTYGKHLSLRSAVVFGGVKINPQMKALRGGVDVLVATPGRLLDLYNQNALRFDQLEILVLDEADRMLDMGFIRDIRKILALLPKYRQNLLFSATFSDEIRRLSGSILHDPIQIEVSPRNATAKTVNQTVFEVDKSRKTALVSHLVRDNNWHQVLIFTRTKHGANRLCKKLEKDNITAAAIHGNKSQSARTKALADFKANRIQVLVATDIAARGIDIDLLPHVINFELPNVAEDYVHRIGRTGRAGSEGEAISLVSADEVALLAGIENLIRRQLVREIEPGFEPTQPVPLTRLGQKPKTAKKTSKKTSSAKPAKRHSKTGEQPAKPYSGKKKSKPGGAKSKPARKSERKKPKGGDGANKSQHKRPSAKRKGSKQNRPG